MGMGWVPRSKVPEPDLDSRVFLGRVAVLYDLESPDFEGVFFVGACCCPNCPELERDSPEASLEFLGKRGDRKIELSHKFAVHSISNNFPRKSYGNCDIIRAYLGNVAVLYEREREVDGGPLLNVAELDLESHLLSAGLLARGRTAVLLDLAT